MSNVRPASSIPAPSTREGQAAGSGHCSGSSSRTRWLLTTAALLLVDALALGSFWLGFAAMLPLLYSLLCLLMLAMCMKNDGGGERARRRKLTMTSKDRRTAVSHGRKDRSGMSLPTRSSLE